MVILGGMGSIPGAILGAAALTILNLDILKTFSEFVRTSLPGSRARWTPRSTRGWSSGLSSS